MRSRALEAAPKHKDSKNSVRAAFEVLRHFYPNVNAIELFAWILLHSDLKGFKLNFTKEYTDRKEKLPVLEDFQHFSIKFPEDSRLYLQNLHKNCEKNTARCIKGIVNDCITGELNTCVKEHYGELWRRVTSK